MRESDLQGFLMPCAEAAFVVGPEGTILLWNAAAEKLFGIPTQNALNRDCAAVLHCADTNGERMGPSACPVLEMSQHGAPIPPFDLEVGESDRRRWVNVSSISVRMGARSATIHLARDINAQKRLAVVTRMFLEQLCALTGQPVNTLLETTTPHSELTERERQILDLLTQGKGTSAIAAQLEITTATVRNHVRNILRKLHAHSRTQAVSRTLREHAT
jgi:DNA-binding CsgD family transcriptional regulator